MRLLSLAFVLVFCLNLMYCAENKPVDEKQLTVEKPAEPEKYPNKSGELALLMREIAGDTEVMRQDLQDGKLPKDLREKWKKIHSSAPTDVKMIDEAFPGMAGVFLAKADEIYKPENSKEMRIKAFHLTLDACISCHENYCPGPISRIRKMYVPKTEVPAGE